MRVEAWGRAAALAADRAVLAAELRVALVEEQAARAHWAAVAGLEAEDRAVLAAVASVAVE